MKFRLTIQPPRRASRTWLPAIASAMLLGVLALQLGWTAPIVLPEGEPITPTRLDPVVIPSVLAAPVIVQRALFGSSRGTGGGDQGVVLDGAIPVGVLIRGGRAVAFVQAPGGAVATLAPGAAYHGWTIERVSPAGVTVRRGDETHNVPIAASPPSAGQQGTPR